MALQREIIADAIGERGPVEGRLMMPPIKRDVSMSSSVRRTRVQRTSVRDSQSEFTNQYVEVPPKVRPTWFVNRDLTTENKHNQVVGAKTITPAVAARNDEASLLPNKARLEGLDQRNQTATNSHVKIHQAMAQMIQD